MSVRSCKPRRPNGRPSLSPALCRMRIAVRPADATFVFASNRIARRMTLGTLFTADFLTEGLLGSPAWNGGKAPDAAVVEARFREILAAARDPSKLNEAQ